MYPSTVLFIALFSRLAQQLSDVDHGNLLKQRYAVIQARQFGPDLSFCYGVTAICSEGNELFDKCSAFEDEADSTQWYQCLCGNGYITADQDCHYCDEAYGIADADLSDLNSSQCSRYNGGTIAPLPSSVAAAVSAFNATYTGVISGAATGGSNRATTSAAGGEGTAAGSATPQTTESTPKSTGASSKSGFSVSHTTTVVQTLNGGNIGTLTAAPTTTQGSGKTSSPSTTLKSGSETGGAQVWNTGAAVVLSMVAVGFSVLLLL